MNEVLPKNPETKESLIDFTKKSLSLLEKETWIIFFKKARNWLKDFFWFNDTAHNNTNTAQHIENNEKIWWNTISEEMFQQLLSMEGDQNFIAKSHRQKFWETFVTWPYGMVYKHIDSQGNPLKKPIPFMEWEHLTEERSKNNAKAYYNKKAKERKNTLDSKWCQYSQCMLDSLVSASWWTTKSTNTLKNYVITHRNNKTAITKFMSTHAITAAWNGKVMPWLVRRRKFEANRFKGIKLPFNSYPTR